MCSFKSFRFLSTPSARRATGPPSDPERVPGVISIHALREEGDPAFAFSPPGFPVFLSTPSARRATSPSSPGITFTFTISIHALREEGDAVVELQINAVGDFYPRPPRGGRRPGGDLFPGCRPISIHALREEGDGACSALYQAAAIFLSTPSARRATGDRVCGV